MVSPAIVKCYDCKYWDTWKEVPLEEGLLLYFCKAFPKGKGIPDEILSWKKPHTKVREDQVGNYVFKKAE